VKPEGGGSVCNFGGDFARAGHTWTRALCKMDSDQDGETNGEELGDPCCRWAEGGEPSRRWQLSHPGDPRKRSGFGRSNCSAELLATDRNFVEFYYAADDRMPMVTLGGVLAETAGYALYPLLHPLAFAQRLAGINPWQKIYWNVRARALLPAPSRVGGGPPRHRYHMPPPPDVAAACGHPRWRPGQL
jgi:hypothetical protein